MSATLYDVPGPWTGRLAIVPRPRGSDWLEDDIASLRAAGVDVLVSALTQSETVELGVTREEELGNVHGIEFVSFPVEDRGVPASVLATAELAQRLERAVSAGRTVAVHCRSGIGRSSLLAAAVLASAGVDTEESFARIERARGCAVPDTPEQRAWILSYASELHHAKRAAS